MGQIKVNMFNWITQSVCSKLKLLRVSGYKRRK